MIFRGVIRVTKPQMLNLLIRLLMQMVEVDMLLRVLGSHRRRERREKNLCGRAEGTEEMSPGKGSS